MGGPPIRIGLKNNRHVACASRSSEKRLDNGRMLSLPGATSSGGGGSRRHHRGPIPDRGDAWRRRTPSVFTSSLDLKRQQRVAAQRVKADVTSATDTQQPEEPPAPPRRRILAAFRVMTFPESDGEKDESDYVPSEDEEEASEEEADSAEELVEIGQDDEGQENETGESGEDGELDGDSRWWQSSEDKRRWEKRYRQKDAAFRKRFGCAIDTPAHPETRRRLRKVKSRHQAYKFVLAGLVIAYLVQLAVVYSASSWAFSMVAWRPSITENASISGGDDTLADTSRSDHVSKPTAVSPQQQVPEHVRTGLHLCSTLSRRVVKSEHDVTATQHALRACDIAVKFAPLKSREAVEARVLRGDLRSLLSHFDGAGVDYKAAMALVLEFESSNVNPKPAPGLFQDLDLKLVANRWTQLYKTKSFKELRREAKARAAQAGGQTGADYPANAVSELAAEWLSAFKKKKPVLDVLTLQRGYTLRRLKYEALDDNYTKPDEV
ncbi:hypothetical protein PHYPSEUDO_008850 [Phytophthora pseudosyringae]|uniref:Uncharacterized protein n=1 Tax=Phytophthora pseudosyringae TaxID=221518 RepID=A0A8T1VIM0_9STRA|nr:hypothetical protein PHYPSEUDO_008850 [Phytophthora pseudosyringae]